MAFQAKNFQAALLAILFLVGSSVTDPIKFTGDYLGDYDEVSVEAFIINGSFANPGEFPHQVSLHYTIESREFFCGGSILTPTLVLTAGHCVEGLAPTDFQVIAGLIDLTLLGKRNDQTRNVTFVYIHEDYDGESLINDIAIIELGSALDYNDHVRNINLPRENETFEGNVTVIGWGSTEYAAFSSKLKKADVRIVEMELCHTIYKKSRAPVTKNNLCAGLRGVGTCNGDSGGPAICKRSNANQPNDAVESRILCGVSSFGNKRCGRSPGVFTQVSSYISWIQQADKNIIAHKAADKLVENGVNAKNDKLETPLHQATNLTDKGIAVKVIKLLIKMGAVVSAEDSESFTFIHRLLQDSANKMSRNRFRDLVDYLLSENLHALFNIQEPTQGQTPLMLAAANLDLDLDTMSLLHSNGVDVTLLDKNGKSALFYAKEGSDNQKLLADILNLGTTKLDDAITGMDKQSVKLLVRLGADVNGRNANLEAHIHHAAASNDKAFATKCIKFLIDNGADVAVTDVEGQTFLHKLLSDGTTLTSSDFLDMAQYLFSRRSSSLFNIQNGQRGLTPLMLAARNMELDETTLKFLGRIGVNFSMVDEDEMTYLFYATRESKNGKLFKKDIESSIKYLNLSEAIEAADEHSVKVLAWLGADLNKTNDEWKTPLHLAASSNNKNFAVNIIKFLINSGANAYARDRHGYTFLPRLVHPSGINPTQFHDIASFLISKDLSQLFNANGGQSKSTPFQGAVTKMKIERATLDLLKNNGVNFNAVDWNEWSVLYWVTYRNRTLRLISDLVDLGANPNHLTNEKRSMLHAAAINGNVELLKFFLEKGLDVNAQDIRGYTPLHVVSYSHANANAFETVQFLLKNGANADIGNAWGKTPLDLLTEHTYLERGYLEAGRISTCFTLGASC